MKSDIDIYLTRVTNGIFSAEIPLHWRIVRQSKIVVLKCIIWSGCADIFRTCPLSYGSQNSTNATQPKCACLNHKERDKQKGFLRAGEGGIILLENHFLIRLRRRLPVTRLTVFWHKPRGNQADDLRLSFTHKHFFRNIFAHQDSAIVIFSYNIK